MNNYEVAIIIVIVVTQLLRGLDRDGLFLYIFSSELNQILVVEENCSHAYGTINDYLTVIMQHSIYQRC